MFDKQRKGLVAAGFALLLACPASGQDTENYILVPGVNEIVIEQEDGLEREVLIRLPDEIPEGGAPVVFGFHGAGGSNMAWHRRLARFVNQRGIISVSPQGANAIRGQRVALWNFKEGSRSRADDIGLVESIIEILDSQNLVNMNRVFATGDSSGGLMSYRLAVDTDLFSAIAPTKSGMAINAHEPTQETAKISLMQVIGNEDQSYNGLINGADEMYSMQERVAIWEEFNACSPGSVLQDDADSVTVQYDCAEDKEMVMLVLKGIGHDLGREWTQRTDALIIEFFLRH